jgi:hypothetical protein
LKKKKHDSDKEAMKYVTHPEADVVPHDQLAMQVFRHCKMKISRRMNLYIWR